MNVYAVFHDIKLSNFQFNVFLLLCHGVGKCKVSFRDYEFKSKYTWFTGGYVIMVLIASKCSISQKPKEANYLFLLHITDRVMDIHTQADESIDSASKIRSYKYCKHENAWLRAFPK